MNTIISIFGIVVANIRKKAIEDRDESIHSAKKVPTEAIQDRFPELGCDLKSACNEVSRSINQEVYPHDDF